MKPLTTGPSVFEHSQLLIVFSETPAQEGKPVQVKERTLTPIKQPILSSNPGRSKKRQVGFKPISQYSSLPDDLSIRFEKSIISIKNATNQLAEIYDKIIELQIHNSASIERNKKFKSVSPVG